MNIGYSDVTLEVDDEEIPVSDVSFEVDTESLITPEEQERIAMSQRIRTRSAEDSRVQKAQRIEVNEVFEPREGIYVADCVNESGEERQRVLIPSKLFSDSEDMIYRADEYVCGKYLLAAANEHDGVRADLALALEEREAQVEEEEQEAVERVREVREKSSNIETAKSAIQGDL